MLSPPRTSEGALPTDYTFTGQRVDASAGLLYYGARYYDWVIGRFTQPDTIIPNPYNPQSLNRYSYVYNNPLRYTDPTGHCPLCVAALAYAKIVLINVAVDTALDFGIAQLTGEEFNLGQSLATNLAIDTVTAGVGGKIAKGGKIAGLVAKYGDEAADALRVGNKVADALRGMEEAAEVAGKSSSPPIVIGENMAERVIPYARQVGAQTINDFIPAEHWSMEANEAWIKQMRTEGREIIDIGPHFERRLDRVLDGIRPDSEAYNLERRLLQGYEGYRKVFQRSGEYWGSVPGFEWE